MADRETELQHLRAFVEWGRTASVEEIIESLERTNFRDFMGEKFNMPDTNLSTVQEERDRLKRALDFAVAWLTKERRTYQDGALGHIHINFILEEITKLKEGKQ